MHFILDMSVHLKLEVRSYPKHLGSFCEKQEFTGRENHVTAYVARSPWRIVITEL